MGKSLKNPSDGKSLSTIHLIIIGFIGLAILVALNVTNEMHHNINKGKHEIKKFADLAFNTLDKKLRNSGRNYSAVILPFVGYVSYQSCHRW